MQARVPVSEKEIAGRFDYEPRNNEVYIDNMPLSDWLLRYFKQGQEVRIIVERE